MANYRSGFLEQGTPIGLTSRAVMLSADNQVVDPGDVLLLQISSDDSTAANRTFTLLPSSLVGRQLLLEFVSGSSTTCQLADTGIQKLSAVWEPVQYDTLSLMSDGTNWIELGRATAASLPVIALTDSHILVGNGSNVATDVAVSGEISVSNLGAVTIGNGVVTNAKVSTSAAIAFSKLAALTSGNIIVGSAGTVPTSVALSGDATLVASGALTIANDAITTVKILNSNVTLAKLASGITPSHVIKFAAANVATTSVGQPNFVISVPGVLATDVLHVTLRTKGGTPRTILAAVPSADTITVTFSGDPSTDHALDYSVMRAAS